MKDPANNDVTNDVTSLGTNKATGGSASRFAKAARLANLAAIALLVLGCFQMVGHFTGIRALRGIGAASVASPFPKVFGSAPVWGEADLELETFSATFELQYEFEGQTIILPITPAVYERVRGPYNRRNVYGAALAYGPCLPPDLMQPIVDYALTEPGTLRSELGLPASASQLRVLVRGEVVSSHASGGSRARQQRQWILAPSSDQAISAKPATSTMPATSAMPGDPFIEEKEL